MRPLPRGRRVPGQAGRTSPKGFCPRAIPAGAMRRVVVGLLLTVLTLPLAAAQATTTPGSQVSVTRVENRAPEATMSWTPDRPIATRRVLFTAREQDADGDNLTTRWDFGYYSPRGRAQADGANATWTFYPAGSYLVNLTVSDGFDTTLVS